MAKTGQKPIRDRRDFDRKKGWRIRTDLVAEKGGVCERCHKTFHPSIFDFHHRDPSTKKFNLSMDRCANNSYEDVRAEFKKCSLLCATCHREVHTFEDKRFLG